MPYPITETPGEWERVLADVSFPQQPVGDSNEDGNSKYYTSALGGKKIRIKSSSSSNGEWRSVWSTYFTYLSNLDMSVFYGVGVSLDQLFHLAKMSLLYLLELLQTQTDAHTKTDK